VQVEVAALQGGYKRVCTVRSTGPPSPSRVLTLLAARQQSSESETLSSNGDQQQQQQQQQLVQYNPNHQHGGGEDLSDSWLQQVKQGHTHKHTHTHAH